MFDQVEAFYQPESVAEALRLLERGKGHAHLVAGGTNLIFDGGGSIRFLIDLTRAGLSYIRKRDAVCTIGATTTLAELEESTAIRAIAGGLLSRAAATCGSVQIRNLATLGGNLTHGSLVADLVTPLLALDAFAVIAHGHGRRKTGLAGYLARAYERPGEPSLLVEVGIPEPPRGARCGWSFQKFGRTEIDISTVNAAAGLQLDSRGRVKWARLALGAVAEVPFRMSPVEELMTGRELDHTLLAQAGERVMREVKSVSDQRASAEFRRELSRVLAGRTWEECAEQAGYTL